MKFTMTNLDSVLKSRPHFADKHAYSQGYGFHSGHVWMWELDHKESWVLKNWCFWIVVLEKTLESPLDSKEIKPVNLKGNQPWILTGRTNDEAETPILWPPDVNSQLTGKDPDAGKDWGQEEQGRQRMRWWWHHWFKGHELGQTLGDGEGQGGLACCSPWGHENQTRLGDWTPTTITWKIQNLKKNHENKNILVRVWITL